jgi:hypothetical protein
MDVWDQEARLEDGRRCLAAALLYLARGWSVVPLCPPDHVGVGREHGRKCQSPGKVPLVLWDEYQVRPPTEAEVRAWWRRWPNANVGIVLGPVSGMVGLDIDGVGGEELLGRLAAGGIPDTLAFRTPGGGRRLLFRIEIGTLFAPGYQGLAKKEEVRLLAHGTQTVAPPSRHPAGGLYEWSSEGEAADGLPHPG